MLLRSFSWSSLDREPSMIVLPVLACVWFPLAIGLWFEHRWAWIGAFVINVLLLFVAIYVAYFGLSAAAHEGWQHRSWLEFVWVVPATVVTAALLHTRRDYFRIRS